MKRIEEILRFYNFENFGKEEHKIYPEEFFRLENTILLDVRSREEMETVSFPLVHSTTLLETPINEIPERTGEIPRDSLIGIFCAASIRATMVFLYLRALGFTNVKILAGGYDKLFPELRPGVLYKSFSDKSR